MADFKNGYTTDRRSIQMLKDGVANFETYMLVGKRPSRAKVIDLAMYKRVKKS